MDFGAAIVSVSLMVALGGLLTTVLAIANKRLFVWEDPRIEEVEELLPGANCGACGSPGCHAFAEQVVAGDSKPGLCTVSAPEPLVKIASLLGVDLGKEEKRVARLACAGGTNVARQRVTYEGLGTCRAAHLVAGGGKGCSWGCLGFGDCDQVCDFDAISMNEFSIPEVDEDRCTACGDCVEICPRDLFSIHPVSHQLWVACKSLAAGDEAEVECEVACNGCSRCAADASPGLISMESDLAVVDYSRNHQAKKEAIDRCPTGAIVWLNKGGEPAKGKAAKKIFRRSKLPTG
jgi:Na+-translocating ferredoxin:NAD+ oxidoreductase RNF subunit RnfB